MHTVLRNYALCFKWFRFLILLIFLGYTHFFSLLLLLSSKYIYLGLNYEHKNL